MNERYLIFGFDMETDVGSTSRDYKGIQYGTPEIVGILEKYGIKATFLFTGDSAIKFREVVVMVNGKGYETGCHSLYHEDLGEPSFNTSSISPVLEEELENRIKLNMEILTAITNKKPVSFRSPRGFGSNKLIEILEKLGFKVDSSYMQSMHLEKDFPYFALKNNWKEEGTSKILELPLFAFNLENVNDNTYQKRLDQWPRIRTHGAEFVYKNMLPIVENQIKIHGFSALTFYLHPWEFYPMPKSMKYAEGTLYYDEFLYKNTGEAQIKEFDRFIDICLEEGFSIVSFEDFREIYCNKNM